MKGNVSISLILEMKDYISLSSLLISSDKSKHIQSFNFFTVEQILFFSQVDRPSHFAALILENCQLPHTNYAHVTLGDPSSMSFYPISSTEVRFLLDLPGKNIPSISNGEMACYLKNKIAPQVCSTPIS